MKILFFKIFFVNLYIFIKNMKNLNNISTLSTRPVNNGNGYNVQPLYVPSSECIVI